MNINDELILKIVNETINDNVGEGIAQANVVACHSIMVTAPKGNPKSRQDEAEWADTATFVMEALLKMGFTYEVYNTRGNGFRLTLVSVLCAHCGTWLPANGKPSQHEYSPCPPLG